MEKKKAVVLFSAGLLCLACAACAGQTERAALTSSIEREACRLCGEDPELSAWWGQDNIGLVDLNTFDVLPVEINRYGRDGRLIEEATGVMQTVLCGVGDADAFLWLDVDRGYAHADIDPRGRGIGADTLGTWLCGDCLDAYFPDQETPAEIAVVNFATRELRPLTESCTWFALDNYLVDCAISETGAIGLRITYRPMRYE